MIQCSIYGCGFDNVQFPPNTFQFQGNKHPRLLNIQFWPNQIRIIIHNINPVVPIILY